MKTREELGHLASKFHNLYSSDRSQDIEAAIQILDDLQQQDPQSVIVNCKSCLGTGDAKNASGSVHTSYSSPCCICGGHGKVSVHVDRKSVV